MQSFFLRRKRMKCAVFKEGSSEFEQHQVGVSSSPDRSSRYADERKVHCLQRKIGRVCPEAQGRNHQESRLQVQVQLNVQLGWGRSSCMWVCSTLLHISLLGKIDSQLSRSQTLDSSSAQCVAQFGAIRVHVCTLSPLKERMFKQTQRQIPRTHTSDKSLDSMQKYHLCSFCFCRTVDVDGEYSCCS